jgi:hypothetical protein
MHAALLTWLVFGPGEPEERIEEHDKIAGLPIPELEKLLRGAVWGPRIRALAEQGH